MICYTQLNDLNLWECQLKDGTEINFADLNGFVYIGVTGIIILRNEGTS